MTSGMAGFLQGWRGRLCPGCASSTPFAVLMRRCIWTAATYSHPILFRERLEGWWRCWKLFSRAAVSFLLSLLRFASMSVLPLRLNHVYHSFTSFVADRPRSLIFFVSSYRFQTWEPDRHLIPICFSLQTFSFLHLFIPVKLCSPFHVLTGLCVYCSDSLFKYIFTL